MMAGGITARTQDYFGWLVAASVGALLSAVVTAICVKYEDRWLAWFWAATFFGSALVAAYCLGKLLWRAAMTELEQALEALGAGVEASGVLLDFFPAGVKTLICWERLVLTQLVED
jgi:hypothetical protein